MLDRRERDTPRPGVPRPDAWLAGGLTGILAGTWLLRADDPYLLTMWGVAFLIVGVVAIVVATGMFLRIWE
jgi:hypothetical protein